MKYLKKFNEHIIYTKMPIDDFAKLVALELGYNDSNKYLGQGGYGMAYRVSDKHVIKITTDEAEAVIANSLRSKNTKYIISYYDVREIDSKLIEDDTQHYVIVMDYASKLTQEESDVLNSIAFNLGKITTKNLLKSIKGIKASDFKGYENDELVLEIIKGLENIFIEAEKYNIPSLDIKSENCGWVHDGEKRVLRIFDIGDIDIDELYEFNMDFNLKPIVI